jgi:Pectate lyase superfamily protein
VIKRGLFILLIWCSFALAAFGQHTTVSATIQDASGQSWAFGTYRISFFNNGLGGPFFLAGAPFDPGTTFSGVLDSTGSFASVSVPSSNFITPVGTAWFVTVCPAATTACFTKTIPITGGTMNLTGLVVPPAVGVPASQYNQAAAYRDTEIQGPYLGFTYYNLTDSTLHVCTGATACTWVSVGSGGGGGSPAGSDTQLQFNKLGAFGAFSNFGVDNSTTPTVLNVPFSATFAGLNPHYDVTSPLYGAKGDGTTDDTAAITAAITALCAQSPGGTLYFPTPPNFYKVSQPQSGTNAIFPLPCAMYIVGGNSKANRPQFGNAPAVAIIVTPGGSPNPAPVFSMVGSGNAGTTIANLTVIGYNEAIYCGGGIDHCILDGVNTSVNGATGIGTAAQPNAAEVYGESIWDYKKGGTASSNSFTTPAIVILNDNAAQSPGIIDFEDITTIGCVQATSITGQTGTAGSWFFRNTSAEDCNTPYLTINDDGTHHWTAIASINLDMAQVSDGTLGTLPTFLKINSGSATLVENTQITLPTLGIPAASYVQLCAGFIQGLEIHGVSGNRAAGTVTDCSGNLVPGANSGNGFGYDYTMAPGDGQRTDLQQAADGGALRVIPTGGPATSTYSTANISTDGYCLGSQTFGPDGCFHETTQGTLDVTFQKAYAPTAVTATQSSGGSIAIRGYTLWVATETSGSGCALNSISPPSLPASITLTGSNQTINLSWTLPISGAATPVGYCVYVNALANTAWNSDGSYNNVFVSGASTTSVTFTSIPSGCCSNFSPVGNQAAVTHFTPTVDTFPSIIDAALTPGPSPICPNGTNGAFTTSGCSGGSGSPGIIFLNSSTAHNAQQNNGASITSGGSAVTCTNCTFVSGDVGKAITLGEFGVGPGSAGALLVSTISAFTDSHHVTIAGTAGTTNLTGNNILWGTADSTAINAAITSLAATGGTLYVGCGDSYLDAQVSAAINVNIIGLGPIANTGSPNSDCVGWWPAGNTAVSLLLGNTSVQQFGNTVIENIGFTDFFSQTNAVGIEITGASGTVLRGNMVRGYNGTGATSILTTYSGTPTQASNINLDHDYWYDLTIGVDSSKVNVDGPRMNGGEFNTKNSNTNFTGQPIGMKASAALMDGTTHFIVNQNAGATQNSIGYQCVNSGTGGYVAGKFEGQSAGIGIGVDCAASSSRTNGNIECEKLAACLQFESGTGNNYFTIADSSSNNTQLVNDLNTTSSSNHVHTQSFDVGPHTTVSALPSTSLTPDKAIVLVTNGASSSDCSSGGGSFDVLCGLFGGTWSPLIPSTATVAWSGVLGSSTNVNTGFVWSPSATGTVPFTLNCPGSMTVNCFTINLNGPNTFFIDDAGSTVFGNSKTKIAGNNGLMSEYNSNITAGDGISAILYQTAATAQTASIGATSMFAGAAATKPYHVTFYVAQVNAGTSCTGAGSVGVNVIYTDNDTGNTYTYVVPGQVSGGTSLVTSIPLTNTTPAVANVGSFKFSFNAKLSTSISYSTTYTAGSGTCSPSQAYSVYPTLWQD